MNWRKTLGILLLAGGLVVPALRLAKVYDPAPAAERISAKLSAKVSPKISKVIKRVPPARAAYVLVGVVPICLGALLLLTGAKTKTAPIEKPAAAELPSKLTARQLTKKPVKVVVDSCNVLQVGSQARNVWQFDARNDRFALTREQTSLEGEPLPASLVAKDWRSLF